MADDATLKFEGDGTSTNPANNRLTNTKTKIVWSSGFKFEKANNRVPDASHGTIDYTITHTPAVLPTGKATLTCTEHSGGVAWTAQEGG
jgi:hypothetical protein